MLLLVYILLLLLVCISTIQSLPLDSWHIGQDSTATMRSLLSLRLSLAVRDVLERPASTMCGPVKEPTL